MPTRSNESGSARLRHPRRADADAPLARMLQHHDARARRQLRQLRAVAAPPADGGSAQADRRRGDRQRQNVTLRVRAFLHMRAEQSTPMASSPTALATASTVPQPQNGSITVRVGVSSRTNSHAVEAGVDAHRVAAPAEAAVGQDVGGRARGARAGARIPAGGRSWRARGGRAGRHAADDLVEQRAPCPLARRRARPARPCRSTAPRRRMSLWKKIATPSSATQPIAARAASTNQRRQPSKPSAGSSETSGSDVTTLAPASRPCAASQGMASAWWTIRRGAPGVASIGIDDSVTLCRDDRYTPSSASRTAPARCSRTSRCSSTPARATASSARTARARPRSSRSSPATSRPPTGTRHASPSERARRRAAAGSLPRRRRRSSSTSR